MWWSTYGQLLYEAHDARMGVVRALELSHEQFMARASKFLDRFDALLDDLENGGDEAADVGG